LQPDSREEFFGVRSRHVLLGALQCAACRECLNLSVINDMKEVI
jgi:hypothetical protein